MGAPKLNAEKKIKISICPFFFFFSFLLEQKYSCLLLQTLGRCMVNSQWESMSQEIRGPENIPLPNLQLLLALISLVYLSP